MLIRGSARDLRRVDGSKTLEQRALSVIRSLGGDAIYVQNGFPRLWTDSAGTTPVTAVGDAVGRVVGRTGLITATQATTANKPVVTRIPKRLGAELVSNGTFDTDTTGWLPVSATLSVVSSRLVITSTLANNVAIAAQQVGGLTIGKTYRAYVDVVSLPASTTVNLNAMTLATGGTYASATASVVGPMSFTFVATTTSTFIGPRIGGPLAAGETATFDNVSVREVLEWTNVISFDGSSDFLQTGITTGNQGWMCAGVRHNASITCYPIAAGGLVDSTPGANLRLINGVIPQVLVGDGTLRQVLQADANITQGAAFVHSAGWDATTLLLGVNNTEKTATLTRVPTSSTITTIGAADGTGAGVLNGQMAAAVLCPVLPSLSQRQLIRRWVGSLQGQTL